MDNPKPIMGCCHADRLPCIYPLVVHDRPANLRQHEMVKFYRGFRNWKRGIHAVFYPCAECYTGTSHSLVFALQRVGTLHQTTIFARIAPVGQPFGHTYFYNAWALGVEYERYYLIVDLRSDDEQDFNHGPRDGGQVDGEGEVSVCVSCSRLYFDMQ